MERKENGMEGGKEEGGGRKVRWREVRRGGKEEGVKMKEGVKGGVEEGMEGEKTGCRESIEG